MKFYNPFKWHVVTNRFGNVYVRKWLFGWLFMDNENNYTWRFKQNVNRWCVFESIEKAFKSACSDYTVQTKLPNTDINVNK